MKKVSTAAVKATKNFSQPKLTIGLDLGDRSSWYCVLDKVAKCCRNRNWPQLRRPCGSVGDMPRCRSRWKRGCHLPR